MTDIKNCIATIRSLYPSLFDVEKKIADYILKDPDALIHMTIARISEETGAADSSIVRFCQKLGFNGFTQLKINLAQNLKKPSEFVLEDIRQEDSPFDITKKVFSSSIQALTDTVKLLDQLDLAGAVQALLDARRVEFYGVGTSASIAADAYYRFMRIGIPAYVATDPHISKISANLLDRDCVAVGISHTGRTMDTVRTMEIAKERGAKTICITSYIGSPITAVSDIKLIASTNEARFMEEAVASRIAHLALLDSLYTCVLLERYSTVSDKLEDMSKILGEMRY